MEEKKIFCQNCGSEIFNPQQEYCLACGAKLMRESAAPENYNIATAWQSFFKRYADFKGRSRRQEYWFAWLANVIINLAFSILLSVFEPALGSAAGLPDVLYGILSTASGLYIFVTIIPTLAIQVRRLHDTGKSGKLLLLWLIPIVSFIAFVSSVIVAAVQAIGAYGYGSYSFDFDAWGELFVEAVATNGAAVFLSLCIMIVSTIVLSIVFLVFFCQAGTPGINKYGKNPKEAQ